MRFRLNPILIVEVALFVAVAVGLGLSVSHRVHRQTPNAPTLSPVRERVQLMPVSSGELWRKTIFNADGSVSQTWIAYQDGRLGVFHYDAQGQPTRYLAYHKDGDAKPFYECRFSAGGRSIVWSSRVAGNGDVTTVEQLADGTTHSTTVNKDGVLVSETTTLADGTSKQRQFEADGTTVKSSQVFTPEPREVEVNDRLKVTMAGARLKEWSYLDSMGNVRERGEFTSDGVVFTFLDDEGRITHRQYWRQMGEDWQQKFYRLDRIDEYYTSSNHVYRQIFFGADSKTVIESRLFRWDGTAMEVRYYDEKGLALRVDFYDYDGKFDYTRPQPTWYTGSEWVYDSLLVEPGKKDAGSSSDSGSIYRLRGRAFASEPTGDDAKSIDPIFSPEPSK